MSSTVGLDSKLVRKTYLITYSKADDSKCPDRDRFSKLILESFEKSTKTNVKPLHWAVKFGYLDVCQLILRNVMKKTFKYVTVTEINRTSNK